MEFTLHFALEGQREKQTYATPCSYSTTFTRYFYGIESFFAIKQADGQRDFVFCVLLDFLAYTVEVPKNRKSNGKLHSDGRPSAELVPFSKTKTRQLFWNANYTTSVSLQPPAKVQTWNRKKRYTLKLEPMDESC